jgi:small subunit ribosomal protein S20
VAKHLSVRKRHRQSLVHRARNRSEKSNLRNAVKNFLAVTGDKVEESFRETSSVVDKAAAKGVIHKNKAARIKSRLSRNVKSKP